MQKEQEKNSWRFAVGPLDEGQRLDTIISAKTGLSRRKAREILKLGGVQVNSRRVRVAGRVPKPGAAIRVTVDDSLGEEPDFVPKAIFEDEWILALNKPPGIPAQGTLASDKHDFFAAARRHFPSEELFLVHRLDSGTSGAMLLAKGPKMAGEIGKLFQGREVKKTYLAAIQGHLEPCEIDLAIGRVPNASPARYGCTGSLVDVRPAVTKFLRAETADLALPRASWILAEPVTGRTHQIRAHLAHLGCPVLGDVLYGGPPSSRLWLHAWKLDLPHPVTKEKISIQAGISIENEAQMPSTGKEPP